MKRHHIAFALLIVAFGLSACSNDSSSIVQNNLPSGSWKVTYFWDKDHDETTDYSGMSFTFDEGGSVSVSSSSGSYSGTWSTGNDDSSDKLYLTFSSPASLIEISDDWIIDSESNNKIELRDDSDNGTELLTFEKN